MCVNEMKKAREKGVVVYAKFCLDEEYYDSYSFCFFEGEDNKYYAERIYKYARTDYSKVINYPCGGKKEVLKAYNLIKKSKKGTNAKKMFFIDRDFDYTETYDNDIYQTPCYSIENFYTSLDVFKKIIVIEFGININEPDYSKCVDDFCDLQNKFHEKMNLFNAWIYCQREQENIHKEKKIKLRDFKFSKMIDSINIDGIKWKIEPTQEGIEEFFPDAYKVDATRLMEVCDNLRAGNPQQSYRGKFELHFFKSLLEDLKKKNKQAEYFSSKRECVKLDIAPNPLSALSKYADTPESLKEFLSQYAS